MEVSAGKKAKEDIWLNHIKSAHEYSGSDKEYCMEHQLNPRTFAGYKRRFGMSPSRRVKRFSKVDIMPATESRETIYSSGLPDPKWLSEFLKAWIGV